MSSWHRPLTRIYNDNHAFGTSLYSEVLDDLEKKYRTPIRDTSFRSDRPDLQSPTLYETSPIGSAVTLRMYHSSLSLLLLFARKKLSSCSRVRTLKMTSTSTRSTIWLTTSRYHLQIILAIISRRKMPPASLRPARTIIIMTIRMIRFAPAVAPLKATAIVHLTSNAFAQTKEPAIAKKKKKKKSLCCFWRSRKTANYSKNVSHLSLSLSLFKWSRSPAHLVTQERVQICPQYKSLATFPLPPSSLCQRPQL